MNSLNQRLIAKDENWSGYINFCLDMGLNPKNIANLNKYRKAIEVQK